MKTTKTCNLVKYFLSKYLLLLPP